jgi:hypothetical protein
MEQVACQDGVIVLAQVGLIAFMPGPTWADPLAILRVGLGLLAALLVWLASAHPRLLPFAAALWLPQGWFDFVPGCAEMRFSNFYMQDRTRSPWSLPCCSWPAA